MNTSQLKMKRGNVRMAQVLLSLALISATEFIYADTIILKSGAVVEGTIQSENDSQIEIETANARRTIFQTKTISKFDIQSIQRDTPAQKAQQALLEEYRNTQSYQLNATTNYTCAYYDQVTGSVFRQFINQHPDSVYVTEITGKITEWEAERAIVAAGKVKYRGQWLDAADAEKQRQQDCSQALLQKGQELLAQGKLEEAARVLEKLQADGQVTSATNSAQLLQTTYRQLLDTLSRHQKQIIDALTQATGAYAQACKDRDAAQARFDSSNPYPPDSPYYYDGYWRRSSNGTGVMDAQSKYQALQLAAATTKTDAMKCKDRLTDLQQQLASIGDKIAYVQSKLTQEK